MSNKQYIGARYVPKIFNNNGSSDWVSGVSYEPLTIVTRLGNSYTSTKVVPSNVGAPEANSEYWVNTGNYNAQIQNYLDTVNGLITGLTNETAERVSEDSALQQQIIHIREATKSFVYVAKTNAQFTTISDAVEYAKTFCTPTNRILIFIAPGIYNETINLHPNPGIDMIGFNATIRNTTALYPEAALFTNGTGYFKGLSFHSTVTGNTYGVHVERDDADTAGTTIFEDCTFESDHYFGCGCGMTPNSTVTFKGCTFASYANNQTDGVGFYLHNAQTSESVGQQTCFLLDNTFSGQVDIRIDDASKYWGVVGTSPLVIGARGNRGTSNAVRFFTTQNENPHTYLMDTNNIKFDASVKQGINNELYALSITPKYTVVSSTGIREGMTLAYVPCIWNLDYLTFNSAIINGNNIEGTSLIKLDNHTIGFPTNVSSDCTAYLYPI